MTHGEERTRANIKLLQPTICYRNATKGRRKQDNSGDKTKIFLLKLAFEEGINVAAAYGRSRQPTTSFPQRVGHESYRPFGFGVLFGKGGLLFFPHPVGMRGREDNPDVGATFFELVVEDAGGQQKSLPSRKVWVIHESKRDDGVKATVRREVWRSEKKSLPNQAGTSR